MSCNIAENVALKQKRPVALFSLEMSEMELAHRFIASQARIQGDKLRKGKVASRDWPKVVKACNTLESAPVDRRLVRPRDARASGEGAAPARPGEGRSDGLGMVIVDYLQLMRSDDPRANRVEQVAQFSRGLKILARELDVPVIGISQLSRAPEQRPDKRPILSDLRESGAIEQDADLVGFLYRDEYYNSESEEPGVAELIIAKHRNGPVGMVKLAFLAHYPKFADLAREEQPVEQAAARARRSPALPRRADLTRSRREAGDRAPARSASATAPAGSSGPRRRPSLRVPRAGRRPGPAGSPR